MANSLTTFPVSSNDMYSEISTSTSDENSADQMAHFNNQFDKVCTDLGTAVIYCHHHLKGTQGQKRSMDRASGSGVFARDPDALLDLIELATPETLLKQEENKAVCGVCKRWLDKHVPEWRESVSQDDELSEKAMLSACNQLFDEDHLYCDMLPEVYAARQRVQLRTAWRIDGTLREYPKFQPVNMWFDYPVHHIDDSGILANVKPEGEQAPYEKALAVRKTKAERKKERKQSLETAIEACKINGDVTVSDLAEYMDTTDKTVRNRIKEHGGFDIESGVVTGKKKT